MNPAMSVVLFTTLAGAAQGLVVAVAALAFGGGLDDPAYATSSLAVAEFLLVAGLAASFGHLGRPERAWRAVLMWRTSWLSREVIVVPAMIGLVGLWWWAARSGQVPIILPLTGIVLAAMLWYCTAMIYACLRFIEEWAHPLTLVTFTLSGLSSGWVLATAIAASIRAGDIAALTTPVALVLTIAACIARLAARRRNAALKPRSTLQSATGIMAPSLRQISMGMSAGAFNTREFFHGVAPLVLRTIGRMSIVFGFLVPAILLALALPTQSRALQVLALVIQIPGLIADRWYFFAQARHPQNLYYQVVS